MNFTRILLADAHAKIDSLLDRADVALKVLGIVIVLWFILPCLRGIVISISERRKYQKLKSIAIKLKES